MKAWILESGRIPFDYQLHHLLSRRYLLFICQAGIFHPIMCQTRQSMLGYKIDRTALVPLFCISNLKRDGDIHQISKCLKGLRTDLI